MLDQLHRAPTPASGVAGVPQKGLSRNAQISSDASDRGQLRHAQTPEREEILPRAFHPDLHLVDEQGGALFRDITVYLRDGSFISVREQESSIVTFLALRNAQPTRYVWHAKGEDILNKSYSELVRRWPHRLVGKLFLKQNTSREAK
jgi:hypothetical protein